MHGFRPSRTCHLILLLGLLTSLSAYAIFKRAVVHYDRVRFQALADEVEDEVRNRMRSYVTALLQAKGFFDASQKISRREFDHYVSGSRFLERFPGVQGLGFAERVQGDERRSHEKAVRSEGFSDYRVWPEGERSEYFPIVFLEPFDQRNRRAFGFDMFSESKRRKAMEQARDTGLPVVTEKLDLVQERGEEQAQPGFLIYVPTYKMDIPPSSVADRRKALRGFVYAPFRVGDLFESVFASHQSLRLPIRVEVFDTTSDGDPNAPRPEQLFYVFGAEKQSSRSRLERKMQLDVANHPWTVIVRPTREFIEPITVFIPPAVGLVGLLLTGLLFKLKISSERERRGRVLIERALATRDEFLSIASHELKTPITPLKLQLDMIVRQARNGASRMNQERTAAALDAAIRSVNRLTQLVEDLLDVSRIANGKMRFHFEKGNLSELVRDVVLRFSGELKQVGCEISLDLDPDAVACFDHFRMEQVFVNLLTNGMKYGGGKPIRVSVKRGPSTLRLEVCDEGIGIPPEDQERIFHRFERVGSSTNIRGLGLGLYIVRMILDAHGASVRVESRPGKGSRFIVEIPIELAAERFSAA